MYALFNDSKTLIEIILSNKNLQSKKLFRKITCDEILELNKKTI